MKIEHKTPRSSTWNIIKSILSAMLGVQSRNKAGQDFQRGNIKTFVLVGIVMFILFVCGLIWVVNLVLAK